MRHYIGYHNTQRMGRTLLDGNPLSVMTKRSVQHLMSNMVWIVQGDDKSNKRYSLGSVFSVSETGNTGDEEFSHFASGRGQAFDPPLPLNDLEWFSDFFKATAHFSLGVQELKDERFIHELILLASKSGFDLPST